MIQRIFRTAAVAALLLLISGAVPADAKYRYGSYGKAGTAERGFFVYLEGMTVNPRNADVVVGVTEQVQDYGGGVNTVSEIVPGWDDEFAGRIGLGYQWASGNKVVVTYWTFETDMTSAGNGPLGGFLHYTVGPPIYTSNGYVGAFGSPGYYEMTTGITAETIDLAFARDQQVSESFGIEWSLGLRSATYEEDWVGLYDNADSLSADFGLTRYNAEKSLKGEMIGARAGIRATYRFSKMFWLGSGLGFSYLDGEVSGASLLSPSGLDNGVQEPSGFSSLKDTGRSGNIFDIDAIIGWSNSGDSIRVWLGWEQSTWNGLVDDLMRNFPGSTAPLRDRDSLTFSGYKLGVYFKF
jgi:hypothetical protein